VTDVLYDPKEDKLWFHVGYVSAYGNIYINYEKIEDSCLPNMWFCDTESSLKWSAEKKRWIHTELCKRLVYIGEL
jgi:hypothetical protein